MLNFFAARFLKSVKSCSSLPCDSSFEIAFLGRSNVGKSTLINCICQAHSLAKTSRVPGKTRHINLYTLPFLSQVDLFARIVDLPGYGYNEMSHKIHSSLQKELDYYLCNRKNLKICVIVIDARHSLTQLDQLALSTAQRYSAYKIIVFNKIDKLNQSQKHFCKVTMMDLLLQWPNSYGIMHSSTKKIGTELLLNSLSTCLKLVLDNSSLLK